MHLGVPYISAGGVVWGAYVSSVAHRAERGGEDGGESAPGRPGGERGPDGRTER